MANVGYCRVSTSDQSLDLQRDALAKAGCIDVYEEVAGGGNPNRIELANALAHVESGDTLVVWRLDRLGRSLRHLVELVNELEERGVGFRSIQENLDTTSSGGRLVFHVFAALAEFERSLIQERTKAGLNAARSRGKLGGRPRVLNEDEVKVIKAFVGELGYSVKQISRQFGISRATLYRYLGNERYPETP